MVNFSKNLGIIGLLAASFFWGAEFVVEKDILSVMGANYSNAIRFFSASLICTIAMAPLLRQISRADWHSGIFTGSFMGLGFAFQTMGLKYISAGENALLCASYILIIPFAEWLIFSRNPGLRVFFYAAVTVTGIAFISYEPTLQLWDFSLGEFLTLAGSVFYAGGIIAIERVAAKTDSRILSLIQFYVITLISIIFAFIFETAPDQVNGKIVLEFLYLIIFATIGAQLLMNYCIQFVKSSVAGIIFATEALFAAVLGILFLKEPSTWNLWIGVTLIVASITLYQMGFPGKEKPA